MKYVQRHKVNNSPSNASARLWSPIAGVMAILFAQEAGVGLVLGLAANQSQKFKRMIGWAGVAAALIGSVLVIVERAETIGRLLFSVAATLVTVRALFVLPSRKRPFVSLACLGSLLIMALYTVWMSYDREGFSPFWQMIGTPDVISQVQWTLAGCSLCYGIGLLLPHVLLRPLVASWENLVDRNVRKFEAQPRQSMRALLLLGGATFSALLALTGYSFLSTRAATPGLSLLSNLSVLYYLALYAANAHAFLRKRITPPLFFFDFLALFYELTSGSKGRFASFVVFPMLLLYLACNPKPSRRFVITSLSLCALSVFVVYPLLVSYRQEMTREEAKTPELSHMTSAASSWTGSYSDKMQILFRESGTAEHVVALASIVTFGGGLYEPSLMWQRLTLSWIPRLLWNSKPSPLSGNEVGRLTGRVNMGDTGTSVVVTGPGELFLYFGGWGFLFMIIPGIAFSIIESGFSCFHFWEPVRLGAACLLLRSFPMVVILGFEGPLTGVLMATAFAVVAIAVSGRTAPPRQLQTLTSWRQAS